MKLPVVDRIQSQNNKYMYVMGVDNEAIGDSKLKTALRWSNKVGKIILTANQFDQFSALNDIRWFVCICHTLLPTANN